MMFQPYVTVPECRKRCCPARSSENLASDKKQQDKGKSIQLLIDMLQEGVKYAYEAIKSFGRYVPRQQDIYPILMFLSEATMASKGYMILPSVARSNDEI